jgi:CheY-like chemotaxis protein
LSFLPQSWSSRRTIFLIDDNPFLAFSRKSVLEGRLREVKRAADAAEALIRVDEPGFVARLGLVIVALTQPGLAGPPFVAELGSRLPGVPILAVGRPGETAVDYQIKNVTFLPHRSSAEDMRAAACDILAVPQAA